MAHPPETRAKLRALYVHDRLPLETAAERIGISYATARRWKADAENDGDDWERGRSAARLAGDGIRNVATLLLDDYLLLHQSTIEAVKDATELAPLSKAEALSRLADAFTKTMSAVAKAAPELNRLAIATDVIQRLAEYTEADFPQHIAAILEIIEPFAADLAKEFG